MFTRLQQHEGQLRTAQEPGRTQPLVFLLSVPSLAGEDPGAYCENGIVGRMYTHRALLHPKGLWDIE